MTRQLHFTFSPVQEYVSEARKTLDLWAGSYMLSYLAARAASAAIDAGAPADAFFPAIQDNPLLSAVRSGAKGVPYGSLPNRFSVPVPDSDTGAAWGRAAADGLRSAWEQTATRAWEWLVQQHPPIAASQHVWQRQIGAQWSVSWVVAEEPGALAGRKQLRAFGQSEEAGAKCTSCGQRQVLSSGDERAFWQAVRSGRLGTWFLVGEKDRLCGICLMKRVLNRKEVAPPGWSVPDRFSSTPDLAADPWRRGMLQRGEFEAALRKFEQEAGQPLSEVEGGAMYPGYSDDPQDARRAAELAGPLARLYKLAGTRPRTHYAVLSMDGDSMGARLAELDGPQRQEMSRRILRFSQDVPGIVQDGTAARLVYAGGEDVLALLPMDTALDTAYRIRERYTALFSDMARDLGRPFTISAGLVYCPMHLPLRTAVRESQRLEHEAKQQPGKDALAASVWSGGGRMLTIARKWGDAGWVREVAGIARRPLDFPTTWLYQCIALLRQLETDGPVPRSELDQEAVARLMAVEYKGSRDLRFEVKTVEAAEQKIAPLVALARPTSDGGRWSAEMLRFIRFFFEEERS